MPELPEVETVVRGLRPILAGATVRAIRVRRPDLRWPVPADLAPRLEGARLLEVNRRAKYGLVTTDRGDTLIFHLGMSGRFRLDPAERLPHDHVEIDTDGHRLALNDPRRFGSLHLVRTSALDSHPLLRNLGPEPLAPSFTAAHLHMAAGCRASPVKSLLLDQRVVAGIGNIYACEALFRAGINPARTSRAISATRYRRLVESLRAVLAEAIAAGGSTLRDHAGISGELGYFQHSFQVYGRAGQPCLSCEATIRRRLIQGRSTFHCPRCQR